MSSPVTVTVTGLKNPATAGVYPNPSATPANIGIDLTEQEGDVAYVATENVPTFDIYGGLTVQSATVDPVYPRATGVTMTIVFTPGESVNVTITLPQEYNLTETDALPPGFAVKLVGATDVTDDATINYTAGDDGVDGAADAADTIELPAAFFPAAMVTAGREYTLTIGPAEADPDATPPVVATGFVNPPTAGDFTVELQAGGRDAVERDITTAELVLAEPEVTLSSYTPSAAVQITIVANVDEDITPNQDITVDLDPFTVPSTIADASVDISSDGFSDSPTNVLVTGKKVTMTIPRPDSDDTKPDDNDVTGDYTIRIKQSAGVTNPASGGEKTVKWVENAPNTAKAANKEDKVTINRVVKVSEDEGTRGTESTATLLGFANGTATVELNGDKLAEVTITDNTGTLVLDTSSSSYKANRTDSDGNVIANEITAEDAAGNEQDVSAKFTIEPSLSLDPTETVVSKSVSLSLSDWPVSRKITAVTVGATTVDLPDVNSDTDGDQPPQTSSDDGTVTFSVSIPEDVNRGSQTVKVTGGDASATATLQVGVLALDVSPGIAVPGQEITIQGSGFEDGDALTSLMVGGETVAIPNNNDEASSNGDVVITVRVPSPADDAIGDGTKKIVLEASGSGRVAEGEVEIPEAEITLSPESSRRGTTVSVTGSGFPSGDLVQIQYDNDGSFVTVTAKAADSSGSVSVDFVVPSYADIGSEHDVQAVSVGVFGPVTAEATHETPGAVVTLTPASVPNGGQLTIEGMNFPAFATVAEMMAGGVDVRPVPAPSTSIDGDFSATVLVPQMELGNQSVSVRVAQTTFTTFLQIVTASVSQAPADVFAGLGDNLQVVWQYDNATSMWASYDPGAPAEINDLTEVGAGDIVWVEVTENQEFQGQQLYAGWNLITLN